MRGLRLVMGLAMAPLVATAVVRLVLPLTMDVPSANVWIAALVTGVIVTLLGGLPVHVVRSQRGAYWVGGYVVAGAFLGTTPFLLYAAFLIAPLLTAMFEHRGLRETPEVLRNLVRLSCVGAAAGAAGAAAFWLAAVYRRLPAHRVVESGYLSAGRD